MRDKNGKVFCLPKQLCAKEDLNGVASGLLAVENNYNIIKRFNQIARKKRNDME